MKLGICRRAVPPERASCRIIPDIGPIAPKSTKLDVVLMWFVAILEDKDQLMARFIEGS
jgi:hypothetical protein